MNSESRTEWAEVFEKIAAKISDLSNDLTDNKDKQEFIEEMSELKHSLEKDIKS